MNISEVAVSLAARQFGTEVARLYLLGGMDGLAYAFEREGRGYVLKVAPLAADHPEHLPRLAEKLDFVTYLADHEVRVARPVRSINGNWAERVDVPEGSYVVSAAVRALGHHVNGRNPAEANADLFRKWGQVTGQMHALAKTYKIWRKPADASEPATCIMDWQEEYDSFYHWCKDLHIREKWREVGRQLAALPQTRDCFGLIHNDLHLQNFLLDDGEITVIDFDVCSYHWFATDIAIPLFFADWTGAPKTEPARRNFLKGFLQDFLAGYSRANSLDESWIKRLPVFLKHHQILLYIVFSNEWSKNRNPWQTNTLKNWRQSILNDLPVIDSL
jgi:amicoumacin kinase